MSGLHPIDIIVLVVYLLGITAVGVWMARRVRNVTEFFMPRRFGKAMMITHAFGTGTASDHAVIVASGAFRNGLSGIWYQWMWLFCTPFYWLIAPIMRRFRAVTTADVYTLRYDRSVAVLFAVVGVVGLSVKTGLLLKTSAVLVESCTGEWISTNLAIAAITALFITYGLAGGLSAAIVTDFIQGILTIVFSFMLLPFALNAVGGMSGIRQAIPSPEMLSLVTPGKITLFFVIMFAIQALVGIVAQPFIMGVCAAGRTETDGRVGFMVGNIVKRLCTIPWCLIGVAAVVWYINQGLDHSKIEPDNVYGDMARAFLPGVLPGLLGVFLASILASVTSSCDSYMISSSGLFTENIYKPLAPGQSEKHYMFVARLTGLIVVVGGLAFAYWVPNVVEGLEIWMKIAPMMGIAFWLGLLWRRMTAAGAWAAAAAGFGTWFLVTRKAIVDFAGSLSWADSVGLIYHPPGKDPEIHEAWVITFYLVAATLSAIVVSLLTRPVTREKLDRFYGLIRTPIQPGEKITEACTLPEGVKPPKRRMLLARFGLEIPMPSKTSVVGFVAGWVAAAALIGGFVWLVKH